MMRSHHAPTIVIVILCFLLLTVLGCGSSRYSASERTLRVMTWNIHHAEGTDGVVDLDRIAELIEDEEVDIVALQEVDRNVPRSKNIDLITALADKTDLTYAFGKTIDFQSGEYGNAFLTRFPILEERNILFKETYGREQRGVLLLVLDVLGEELAIANTHLDHHADDSTRISAVNELRTIFARLTSRPTLLVGDLNAEPGSPSLRPLTEMMADSWTLVGEGDGFTFPSRSPQKRIDYIFSSKTITPDSLSSALRLSPTSARVVRSSASDHLPLIVDFRVTTEH